MEVFFLYTIYILWRGHFHDWQKERDVFCSTRWNVQMWERQEEVRTQSEPRQENNCNFGTSIKRQSRNWTREHKNMSECPNNGWRWRSVTASQDGCLLAEITEANNWQRILSLCVAFLGRTVYRIFTKIMQVKMD